MLADETHRLVTTLNRRDIRAASRRASSGHDVCLFSCVRRTLDGCHHNLATLGPSDSDNQLAFDCMRQVTKTTRFPPVPVDVRQELLPLVTGDRCLSWRGAQANSLSAKMVGPRQGASLRRVDLDRGERITPSLAPSSPSSVLPLTIGYHNRKEEGLRDRGQARRLSGSLLIPDP